MAKETISNHRITVELLGSGWTAIHLVDVTDGTGTYTDVQQTGIGRHENQKLAVIEAIMWSKADGIPLTEDTQKLADAIKRRRVAHRAESKKDMAEKHMAENPHMIDLHGADSVEVMINDSNKLWINVDGVCALRVGKVGVTTFGVTSDMRQTYTSGDADHPNPPKASAGRMTFSRALEELKVGNLVAREGWNGKGMYLYLVPGSTFTVNRATLLGILGEGARVEYRSHIDMMDAFGKAVPWLASQTDLLSDDWIVVSS